MELGYLISPVVQIVDYNGKPVVGAKIYVYNANTTVLVDTYNDFEGHLNTNPVLTDTLGNCTIIADNSKIYDIIVNDENDNLLFGKKNITITSGVDPSSSLVFESGYGISIERTGNTVSIAVDTDLIATQDDLATKQDKLYAGDNIEIDNENKINVIGRKQVTVISPLKMDLTNDRAILYIEGGFSPVQLSAGTDLKIEDSIVSVDTNGTINSGTYNFIAGYDTWISGNNNIVAGSTIGTKGGCNAAFGGNNNITGNNNIIGGFTNKINGNGEAVFGENNYCNGNYDFIGGTYTSAVLINDSLIYGYRNDIKSSRAGSAIVNIIGNENNVSGDNVHILGADNDVTGTSNYILGSHNSANSYNGTQACVAVGDYNKVSQYNSFTFGNRLSANNEEILIGLGPSSTSLDFSGTYLKITTAGLFKVVNGVETQL